MKLILENWRAFINANNTEVINESATAIKDSISAATESVGVAAASMVAQNVLKQIGKTVFKKAETAVSLRNLPSMIKGKKYLEIATALTNLVPVGMAGNAIANLFIKKFNTDIKKLGHENAKNAGTQRIAMMSRLEEDSVTPSNTKP